MTPSRDPDELATWSSVLQRAQAGSARDFELIYAQLSPGVAGYLRMSSIPDVDSLTNEVFLHALKGLARFSGDWERFRSWVFTIAHHRIVDERRRAARRPATVPMELEVDGPVGDVELDALEAMSADRVQSLLAELSEDQRAVLLLRVVADLPLKQVADALGKSVGAVKALQHRALARMRLALDAEQADA